jgi:hypothetical protein
MTSPNPPVDQSPSSDNRKTCRDYSLTCLVFSIAFFATSFTAADVDLWGHVRFGSDILTSGMLPREDPYSYLTAKSTWINHEWLCEVLFALAYRWGGAPALVALKQSVVMCLLGVLYRYWTKRGIQRTHAEIFLFVVTLQLLFWVVTVRPQLFTYLGMALVLILLNDYQRRRDRKIWFTPLIFLAWANLHGGFFAGLAVLLVWVVLHYAVECVDSARQSGGRDLNPALVLLSSIAATLLNPYGWSLHLFLGRTATVPRPDIAEWQTIQPTSLPGICYLAALSAAILGCWWSQAPRRPASLGVLAGLAIAPFVAARHAPLFAIAWAIVAAEHVASALEKRFPNSFTSRKEHVGRPTWAAGMMAGASLALLGIGLNLFRCIELRIPYPIEAVARLKAARVAANLAIDFNWGEFAIWHLGPNVKVSMDGRRETVYSQDILNEYLQFESGRIGWDRLLDRSETEFALVRAQSASYLGLKSKPGWVLIHDDHVSGLFVRSDSPWREPLSRIDGAKLPDDGVGLCFPAEDVIRSLR